MKTLMKRMKYKLLSWKRGYDVEAQEISQRAYDRSIERIVQAYPVFCLCEVDRVAKPVHNLIQKYTDAYNEACEYDPERKESQNYQVLLDNLLRQEIMLGALFATLHMMCDNWKTDSKEAQQSIDLYERYYKAYKKSGRKADSCHK